MRGAARLIVPCDHPLILTAPRYTIFLRGDAVSNRIHPINAPPGRCGCRRDDRHRGSKPSRGRSQGSRPFREYQPSTDGGWFPHYSGSSHGRSSPMDTRKCSAAVIGAKTPVTLWRQEMAPGFAPAPVLTQITGCRSSPAGVRPRYSISATIGIYSRARRSDPLWDRSRLGYPRPLCGPTSPGFRCSGEVRDGALKKPRAL